MPSIRNMCVARGVLPNNAQSNVYVVPANFAFILKYLAVFRYGAQPARAFAQLADPVSGAFIRFFDESVPTATTVEWSKWTVMNSGDQIQVYSADNQGFYWIAGAVLPYNPSSP